MDSCKEKAYFYGFRPKTVRSPSQKHTVSEPKPYVFGTETVERTCLLRKTD